MKKESSVNFDDLDQERDDLALETEGIDDMEYFLNEVSATLKESGGSDISRIKILEKGLEDDKRRLANMEMQLREAKRQRDAENQMTVVTKQSKMLETMMGALSTAAHKEMGNRQRWEMEWRERFADFQTQHREMEEALKRKHLQELKAVKDEIQRDIRRVANEVQRTKGKNMPSPRTLSQMQEGNMGRILILFQKHGLERMTLASKVSKQEETLVHAKNQSLQKMMNMSQTKSTGLYKKILPSIKTGKRFELEDDADEVPTGGATQSTGGRLSHDGSLSPATRDQSRQRSRSSLGASRGGGNTRERTNTSWSMRSAAPLPSPRIDYNNTTFLTGIEDEYEGNPKPGSYARPSKVNNSRGEAGDTAANVSAQKHDGDKESSILHTAQASTQGGASSLLQSIPNQHVGPNSYFRNPENAQFAKGVPDPASYRGGGPEYMTNPNVGQEFAKGWAPPAPPAEAGRPNWNEGGMTHGFPQAPSTTMLGHMGQGLGQQLGQQWHPNIIAFDKSTTGYGQDQTKKASTKNPYLAPQPLSKKAKGGGPTSAQGTQKERSNGVADKQNSSGARGTATQAADPRRRSKSTEPVHSKTFPKVSDSGRQQPTDQNSNRPFSELGKNDDYSLLQKDKVGKLETWIEDKIKGVLGNSASRSNILDRLATASSFGDLAGPSRGTTGFATRAPTGDYSLASTAPGDYAEEGGSRMQRVPSISQGIRGDSNAVAGLMNSLKTRIEDDPKISKAMSHNTGFGMEDQNYKQKQIREYEQSHKGASVEQDFEAQTIESSGKFGRDGKWTDMPPAPEDINDRRALYGSLENDRNKTPKRVNFRMSPRSSDGDVTRAPSIDLSRPGTSGVSSEGAPRSADVDEVGSDFTMSRPGTTASGVSTFVSRDDDDEPPKVQAEQRQVINLTPEEKVHFFSLIRHNKVPEIEDLLSKGFPIVARDQHGNTPLMVAAQNGHKRLCKLALKFGAEPNASNHQGNTSLHFATAYGYSALSKYLISKGADDTLMNMKGLTCYDGIG